MYVVMRIDVLVYIHLNTQQSLALCVGVCVCVCVCVWGGRGKREGVRACLGVWLYVQVRWCALELLLSAQDAITFPAVCILCTFVLL